MIINGIEFDFSTLNANDVDRMLAAQEKQQERAKTEGSRYTPESNYPAWLRFQCRIFMDYLDEVLGEGASEKLGLDGSNFNDCMKISKAFADAMAAEKAEVSALLHPAEAQAQTPTVQPIPAPMNREQRRAAGVHKHTPSVESTGGLTHQLLTPNVHTHGVYPLTEPGAHTHQRELYYPNPYEVSTPDDAKDAQAAVEALKDDPEAMRQLAEVALKLAAERHV